MRYLENDRLELLIKLSMCDYKSPEVEEFKNIDDSDVVLSNRYYAKKNRIINRYRRRPTVLALKKALSVVSVACLVIVLSVSISIISVSSLRNAVWNAIVKWYEDYITIRYQIPDEDTFETVTQDTNQPSGDSESDIITETQNVVVTPPTKIENVKKPTYLPEGVEEDLVIKTSSTVMYEYYKGDDFIFNYTQYTYTEDDKYFDNETARVKEIGVGEDILLFIEYDNNPEKILLWEDKTYVYKLVFEENELDEMVKVAQSVK